MRPRAALAGIAALVFSVLTIVGLFLSAPPGGSYSAHDATKYISHGHHAAVFVSAYLLLLATIGLVWLLAYLREATFASTGAALGRVFWGTGLCAAASLAVGWSLILGPPIATAFGGKGVTLDPRVTYVLVEMGSAAVWGAGGVLLGFALFALMLGTRAVFPAWLRAATGIAAVGGIAAVAFFPSALVILWGVAIGIWLLLARRRLDDGPVVATLG
jgi:hypothetical protein